MSIFLVKLEEKVVESMGLSELVNSTIVKVQLKYWMVKLWIGISWKLLGQNSKRGQHQGQKSKLYKKTDIGQGALSSPNVHNSTPFI